MPVDKDAVRGRWKEWLDYEENVIRKNVFGKFKMMLYASATHPAMLEYLDQQVSRRGEWNENYAREVMELHTLGADKGYTDRDVMELSKALTTLGRPGVQVAAITRRAEGYFIVHVDSGKPDDYPLLNGTAIGAQATRLADNDVIQLAGVKMGFFVT